MIKRMKKDEKKKTLGQLPVEAPVLRTVTGGDTPVSKSITLK